MKKNLMRVTSLLLVLTFMVMAFAGCGGKKTEKPVAAQLKTDLKDAEFTFTYGDLRKVLPGDKLATLFENTNKKTDDKTVTLSFYELVAKFSGEEYFENLLSLIPAEQFAALSANRQEVLDYFNGLINHIKQTGEPRVSYSEGFWVDNSDGGKKIVFKNLDGTEAEGQSELRAAFRLYSDSVLKKIGSYLMNRGQDEATEHGADLTNEMYPFGEKTASTLTLDDLYLDEETRTYPIYSSVIPTLIHDLDEKGDNAEDENGEYIFIPSDLNRTICITVKPEEASVKKAFTVREKDGIIKEFEKAQGYLVLNSFEIGFNPCTITTGINAETDEMNYVTYNKNMVITANVTFKGALEKYGTMIVEFPCTSSLTYNFGWAENAE